MSGTEARAHRPQSDAAAERSSRLRALVIDDGTPGGIRRAVEYLIAEWAGWRDASPAIDRLELRGDGSLLASGPRLILAMLRFTRRLILDRPELIHLNITQRGSTYRALPVVALARFARVPVLIHLHSSEYRTFIQSLPAPALALVRWMFRSAHCVAVLGESWAVFARNELQVDPSRLEVVPNAVPGPLDLNSERAPGPLRLLFLGQVGRRKGAGDLLEALADPRVASLSWRAVFAGDGDIEAYRQRADECGLRERVHFTGWLDQSEVQRELRAADVMILPSLAEGLPLSVLEGLAHGIAVIATPVGAIGEVIVDGQTGLLTPPGNPNALAGALQRLLTDEPLRRRLAATGRVRWERDHDVRVYARSMASLYERTAALP